jgi:hypothetical protein
MMHTEASSVTEIRKWSHVAWGAIIGVAGALAVAVVAPEYAVVLAVPLTLAGVLAMIDQRTGRIATAHAGLLAAVTLGACGIGIAVDRGSWSALIVGAAVWTIPFFLLAVFAGFGGGDFKFAFSLGAATGWVSVSCSVTGLCVALLLASVTGMVVAVRQRSTDAPVRLGLPLFTGAVLAVAVEAAVV